jgi:ABC-type sulfate transport system permease subunit
MRAARAIGLTYLAALLVLPVGMVLVRAFGDGIGPAWTAVTTPEAQPSTATSKRP